MVIVPTAIGVLVGGVIAFFITKHYYVLVAEELKEEAEKLRHLTTLILKGLENAKLIELSRDTKGNIKGLNFTAKGETAGLSIVPGKLDIETRTKDS